MSNAQIQVTKRIHPFLVAIALAASCAPTPQTASLTPSSLVNVKIAIVPSGQIEERPGQVEEIVQDNCTSSIPSTNTISRSLPVVHEVRLDSRRALSSVGSLQLSDTVRDVPLGQMIAQKHNMVFGATTNVDTSINLTSEAHSKVIYRIQQVEKWEKGQVTITIGNGDPMQDGYLLRTGLFLKEIGANVISCALNAQAVDRDATPINEGQMSATLETPTPVGVQVASSDTPGVDDVMALPLETPNPLQPTPTKEPVLTSIATLDTGGVNGVDFVEADSGTDRLIVRDGPGTNYGELSRIPSGTRLKVIDSSQNSEDLWWQVVLPDGREGWVRDRFVAVNGQRKPDQQEMLGAPTPQPRSQASNNPAPSSSAIALGGNRFRISARSSWQETGLYVNVGNFVDIRYTGGQWRITPQSPYANHEGYPASKFARNPKPELRSGVLICRIASPTLTAIVEPRNGGFRTGARGNIACRINDDRLDDNDGALEIQIVVS